MFRISGKGILYIEYYGGILSGGILSKGGSCPGGCCPEDFVLEPVMATYNQIARHLFRDCLVLCRTPSVQGLFNAKELPSKLDWFPSTIEAIKSLQ